MSQEEEKYQIISELKNIIKISKERNFKRTITNIRLFLNLNIEDFYKLYDHLEDLIYNHNIFDKFINNFNNKEELKKIKEIKFCKITKDDNITNSIFNPNIIEVTKHKNKKKKNIYIEELEKNTNTELIKNFLLNTKNNFSSFAKKKNKKKQSLSVWKYRKIYNVDKFLNSEIKTQFHHLKLISLSETPYIVKNIYNLTLNIQNEKILTSGRIMLPNTISIWLHDQSRIVIYRKKFIQLILSKSTKDETIIEFEEKLLNILSLLSNILNFDKSKNDEILKLYKSIKTNNINNIKINYNCNFTYDNYIKNITILPSLDIFIIKHIHYSDNNLNLISIKSLNQLIKCFDIISNYEEKLKNIDNILKKYNNFDILFEYNNVINDLISQYL